ERSGTTDPLDDANVWGAWPQVTDQWLQYDWAQPVTVDEIGVYFGDELDAEGNGVGVPREWSAQDWDAAAADGAGCWAAVAGASEYTTEKDAYNAVTFDAVTTTRMRLLLSPQGTESGHGSLAVKEWQVFETGSAAPAAPPVDVTVAQRCVAGKVVVVTTAKNR